MSFGRNMHVAKAEAAELKAQSARDASSSERAWREAGRLWERAAAREADPKRKQQYERNAERARASADQPLAGLDAAASEELGDAELAEGDELTNPTARIEPPRDNDLN